MLKHEDDLGIIPDWATDHLGRYVTVTLNYGDPDLRTQNETVTGVLLDADIYGEIEIDTADGIRYCWPALEIVPASPFE